MVFIMRIKFITAQVLAVLFIISGCSSTYTDKTYIVSRTSVVQEPYIAFSEQPESVTSSYRDGFSRSTNAVVQFKFSINGADNEGRPGNDHFILIKPENKNYITPVYVFGEVKKEEQEISGIKDQFLPANSEITVTFRVDFNSVLKSFIEKGYYEAYSGSRINKEDFEGLFIAGATEPLSWNFGEIQKNPIYKMTDPDNDGIYECRIIFRTNDYRALDEHGRAVWKLKKDISGFPKYETQDVLHHALYNMALEELLLDIRPDSTFMAGAKWNGVWTRDISYSIYLSLALTKPDVAKNSLMKKVSGKKIIQDTGTGGSWPVSTDRIVWAVAAWEVYLVTGDSEWLKYSYEVIKNTVNTDLLNAYSNELNLVYGESSFLDWREQTYPLWMDPKDIYKSICLGTNALHFRTYEILNFMEKELGISENKYSSLPGELKEAINGNLWLENKGYYGQYLYGRELYSLSPKSESLGEALSVLFKIADDSRSKRIIENMPLVEFGTPCIYPQIKGIPPYHNNAIWPFVLAYWTWASAKTGNEKAVEFGLDAITRAAALFLTNKENMVADNGHFDGTEINSDRMLWSIAGNIASVYRVLFGINLSPQGLVVEPFVPQKYEGTMKLSGLRYRNAVLDITIHGYGSGIREAYIDGIRVQNILIEPGISGNHKIEIVLNGSLSGGDINIVENHFSPETPAVYAENSRLKWQNVAGNDFYKIIKNGKVIAETNDTAYNIQPDIFTDEYSVIAVDKKGYESFMSEPIGIFPPRIIEAEPEGYTMENSIAGFTGKGYIRTTPEKNTDIVFEAEIIQDGYYSIDFKYANGNGPINTFNACGIRTLFVNDSCIAAVIFPQRGDNLWNNWGYSNSVRCYLKKGKAEISLKYLPANMNMNGDINEALIDFMRVLPVK
jgi:hypothetical protein